MVYILLRSILLCCIVSQVSALYFNLDSSDATTTSGTASTAASSTATSQASQSTAVSPLGSGSDVFKEGGACRASWIPASSSSANWKSMTIDLMTGSNLQMTKLGTVATNIDGTDPSMTSYNYTCPQVSPNSAIYFLQYTDDEGNSPTWTTRFAISDPQGQTVPPPEANQPQGGSPAIPWGEGALVMNNTSTSTSASASTTASISSKLRLTASLPTNTGGSFQSQLANAYSSILKNGGSESEYQSMNAARSSSTVRGGMIGLSLIFVSSLSFVL